MHLAGSTMGMIFTAYKGLRFQKRMHEMVIMGATIKERKSEGKIEA